MAEYLATSALLICKCGKGTMFRSKQQIMEKGCQCGEYTLKLSLGFGKNNYRATIRKNNERREEQIFAAQFDQM